MMRMLIGVKSAILGLIVILMFVWGAVRLLAVDAYDLSAYVGYYLLAASYVDGDFEGADFGEIVKLENGMIFEFQEFHYSYSYRPQTVIMAVCRQNLSDIFGHNLRDTFLFGKRSESDS